MGAIRDLACLAASPCAFKGPFSFNSQKGHGFIAQDSGGPDVFVHISAVERAGMRSLVEGQKLTFDIETDRRNGKSAAANLQAA